LATESQARLASIQAGLPELERRATLGALTAGIVHQVRDPLNIIQGLTEALAEAPPSRNALQRDLKTMREQAVHANQMLGELLKYTRAAPLDIQRRDLRQTVANAIQLTSYPARQAQAKVNVALPDEPVYVEYDATQIEQVLVNVLLNGLQAMETGGTLHVRVRPHEDAVSVSVQDTGAGITPANMARIFEPFFTTRDAGRGRGLGLAVSQAIVAAHNGRLDVASRVGEGSTFTLWLPLTQAPQAGQELVP
jgi:signal transduction histidine kinase